MDAFTNLELVLGTLTAAFLFLGGLVGFLAKLKKDVQTTDGKVDEIHVMVNDRMEKAQLRIRQLTLALKNADIEIPDIPKDED